MNPLQAIILGVVQGLTEFFPVSSSGHLVLFQHLFGLREPALFFDISVHVGTLLAVLLYFYKDIANLFKSVFRFFAQIFMPGTNPFPGWRHDPDLKMAGLILVGSIPTTILGLGFHQIADQLFASLLVVGFALCFTAVLLLGTRLVKSGGRGIIEFTLWGALIIGVAQGMSVIPGISRSGATIAACLMLGLNRDAAARFSFLLAIPAILGALVLNVVSGSAGWGGLSPAVIGLGVLTSAGVGYLALATLIKIVRHGQLFYFAPYCLVIGVVVLLVGK